MDNDEKNNELDLTPEEQKADEEAQKEVNDEELKSKIAEDLGIDPEIEDELIKKLVEREKAHHEKLTGAIKQKINWRTKALKSSEKGESESPGKSQQDGDTDIDKIVEQKIQERMDAQDLDSLSLPDELKDEVRDLAKFKGISIREAAQLPYIKVRIDEVEKEERIKNAIPKRSSKGSYSSHIDLSKPLDPEDFDFNSEEGVKAWKEAKAARDKHRALQ